MMILLRATAVKVFSSLNHALMEAVCAGINQMEKINIKDSGATIAQWIFIRLSSCSPNLKSPWDVVVVKWSACSPYTPTIRVRIPLKAVFLNNLWLKWTLINKKRLGLTHWKKSWNPKHTIYAVSIFVKFCTVFVIEKRTKTNYFFQKMDKGLKYKIFLT